MVTPNVNKQCQNGFVSHPRPRPRQGEGGGGVTRLLYSCKYLNIYHEYLDEMKLYWYMNDLLKKKCMRANVSFTCLDGSSISLNIAPSWRE